MLVVYPFESETNPGERKHDQRLGARDQNDTGSFGDQTQTPGHSKKFTAIYMDMSFEISYLIKKICVYICTYTHVMCVCVFVFVCSFNMPSLDRYGEK